MTQTDKSSLALKVTSIPEEDIGKNWDLPAKTFSDEVDTMNLTGSVQIKSRLRRHGENVHFLASINYTLELVCSRCLKDYSQNLNAKVKTMFVAGSPNLTDGGEVQLDDQDMDTQYYQSDEINVYEPVRDSIALGSPMRPLCGNDCKGLCPSCGANLNEINCQCDKVCGDPRLSVLKTILK